MAVTLENLPDKVRIHAVKMREHIKTIENAPVQKIGSAVEELKAELDALVASANEAAGRRV